MTDQEEDKKLERYERDAERVEQGFWPKVRKFIGRVPFIEDAVASYYCAVDPKTPFQVKAIIMGALAYFVLPTDMVPDIIAGLGFGDDAAVFYAAWKTISGHVTPTHFAKARETLRRISGDDVIEG
ncbi:MAG: YkvA family protein [Limibacillus sp.]|jgi:uncharacterized membrane protein YkvA (DUF1232 family)